MKAPDKIYLWENPIINGGYDPAWHINSLDVADIEYIRKDALLEWAEGQLKASEDEFGNDDNTLHLISFKEVIDKINEL